MFLLQPYYPTCQIGKHFFLQFGLLFQSGDFGGIAPSEYITAAVVKSVTVILFVAFTR